MGVVALLAAGASIWAWTVSAGHIEIAGEGSGDGAAARAPVAIVLGAAVHADGQPSPWLAHRPPPPPPPPPHPPPATLPGRKPQA